MYDHFFSFLMKETVIRGIPNLRWLKTCRCSDEQCTYTCKTHAFKLIAFAEIQSFSFMSYFL